MLPGRSFITKCKVEKMENPSVHTGGVEEMSVKQRRRKGRWDAHLVGAEKITPISQSN